MTKFSDLNIKATDDGFVGYKRRPLEILNMPIMVTKFAIKPSKIVEKGKAPGSCLYLQIEMNSVPYVVFTGSNVLMNMIQQVKPDDFPIETTIVKVGDRYEFS